MEVKPVRKTKAPKYPQKNDVTTQDIKKAVPGRWAKSAAAKVALGALAVATLAGCDVPPGYMPGMVRPVGGDPQPVATPTKRPAATPRTSPTPTPTIDHTLIPAGVPMPVETPVIDDFELAGEVMAPVFSVAPLFVHGDGRGSMGCVMIAPPVFLSEAEALEIINEAAAQYGLVFSGKTAPMIYEVCQPVTNLNGTGDTEDKVEYIDMKPDFADESGLIALEYVSVDDVRNWAAAPAEISVEQYDTKDAATQLQDSMSVSYIDEFEDFFAGVLYDPCSDVINTEAALESEERREELRQETVAKARAELAAQVKDFFAWLEDQGIL